MMIVAHHAFLIMLPFRGHWLAPAFAKCGLLGMSLFFVLSGFVIQYNYAAKLGSGFSEILKFLVARFARLYPLYFIFVIANFFYTYSLYPSYAVFLPFNILGIQSWTYKIIEGVNVTLSQIYANNSWSISTELMLYILFIPIAFFGRFTKPSLWKGIVLLLVGIVGRVSLLHFAGNIGNLLAHKLGENPSVPASHWVVYLSPYGRFFEFLAGTGLAEVWMAGPLIGRKKQAFLVLGLAGLAYLAASMMDLILFSAPNWFKGESLDAGYAIAVPFSILGLCIVKNPLSGAIALAVGEASYSIYLLHSDLFPLFYVNPEATRIHLAVNLVLFLAVLGLTSSLTYRYIEMPAKRHINSAYRRMLARPLRLAA